MGDSTLGDRFYADLHIHSKYSRACSRDCDLPNLAWWARRKGIAVLGTGDFTHPAWYDHLRESLDPAEPGLYRLSPEPRGRSPGGCRPGCRRGRADPVRFMLSVEISTIYKRDDRTRKVHHLIYLPDLDAVARFNTALGRIGNLSADGRPILGLDSRDLLEITLEASPDGYLVPAHIWTPWFSALGSKSGFDAIADCYADLADHIFAVETGLSSDPEMNWRVSSLDRYRLVSNSDAHSPPALAREATLFSTARDYFAIRDALRTGDGLRRHDRVLPRGGQVPRRRAPGLRRQLVAGADPAAGGRCPECGKPLTVGVLSRVEELADRPAGHRRARPEVTHLIQLAEILGEINGVGPEVEDRRGGSSTTWSPRSARSWTSCTVPGRRDRPGRRGAARRGDRPAAARRGAPGARLRRRVRRDHASSTRASCRRPTAPAGGDAVRRTRAGAAQADGAGGAAEGPTTGGEGRTEAEARARPRRHRRSAPPPSPHEPFEPMLAGMEEVGTGLLDRLDAMQRVAASAPGGPLLIVAGPGTGKTRTLTHRIAYLCRGAGRLPGAVPGDHVHPAGRRGAAAPARRRCSARSPRTSPSAPSTRWAWRSCGRTPKAAGLPADFRIADDAERRRPGRRPATTTAVRGAAAPAGPGRPGRADHPAGGAAARRPDAGRALPGPLARGSSSTSTRTSTTVQYELLRLLSPADGNLCAIGDPDQAIYSFRGADVGYFLRFSEDFTDARLVRLTRNYRSSAPILAAAVQAIAPSSLVRGRGSTRPGSTRRRRWSAATRRRRVADEADFVVRTVDELVGGLSHRSLDSGRASGRPRHGTLSFSDIAVLYRTDAQAAPIVDALARAGVPVQKRSHNRLAGPARCAGDRPGAAARRRPDRCAAAPGSGSPARCSPSGTPPHPGRRGTVRPEDVWTAADLLTPLAQRVGDDLAVPVRSSPPAPRWTRSTRAPRRSTCSPCTPRRAWSSRSCSSTRLGTQALRGVQGEQGDPVGARVSTSAPVRSSVSSWSRSSPPHQGQRGGQIATAVCTSAASSPAPASAGSRWLQPDPVSHRTGRKKAVPWRSPARRLGRRALWERFCTGMPARSRAPSRGAAWASRSGWSTAMSEKVKVHSEGALEAGLSRARGARNPPTSSSMVPTT